MISIYVGNLPYDTTEQQLVDLFSPHGKVERASLVTDRESGRPRGFGFVEMENDVEARRAIEALIGQEFSGRPLTVNEARRNTNRNVSNLSKSAHRTDPPPPDDLPRDVEDDHHPDHEADESNDTDHDHDNGGGYSNEMGKA